MAVGSTKVIQVTNIAPQATKDQMQTLFGYLGKIEDIRLYPTIRDVSCPVQSRICYIKFIDSVTVGIAQHMTNTVFIDRALIVIPVQSGDIPDEYYALEMTKNGTIVPGLCPSEPKLPPNVVNSISGTGSDQVITTTDPQLDVNGLPPYPALPANYDSVKIEEIRKTVLVGNIEPGTATNELVEFFTTSGEVKYMRACNRASDTTSQYFLIEFSEQPSVLEALKLDGKDFRGKPICVQHSIQAIVKPQAKSNEAAQKEIEEAMSRVKEAQNMISAAIDPVIGMLSKDKRSSRRSRSRSRGRRRRSRSRSRSRRSRSRERRRRSRTRSRERRRRSKSRRRSRSRSRRSRSRSRKSRSKSHSRTSRKARRSSKERSRDRRSRDKDRDKDRDHDRSRERSSRRDVEKERRSRDKDKEHDARGKSRDKDRSIEKEKKSVDKDEKNVDKRRSRSISRGKYRSHSRERKSSRSRDKKRSRSRDKRKSSSSREVRRRSRSRSRDKKKEKRDKKDKERSSSRSKVPRNYDEEEKGFDEKTTHESDHNEKESSEKSDNMDISNSP